MIRDRGGGRGEVLSCLKKKIKGKLSGIRDFVFAVPLRGSINANFEIFSLFMKVEEKS